MQVSPPKLAREQWESHPRFPSQVLLLRSHDSFRAVSRELIARAHVQRGWAEIDRVFHSWIGGMRSHEGYEENKLYPYLARRWGLDFTSSKLGHVALHGAADAVFSQLRDESAQDSWVELAAKLERHDEVLRAHLEIEEQLVIPALLALPPPEFDRLTQQPLPRLLADLDARSDLA